MKTYQSLLYYTIGASILVASLLTLVIRERKIPRWLDIFVAIVLFIFSAIFLGILSAVRDIIPTISKDGEDLKAAYNIAILIIPFFTASLGTNILAHAILSDRDYSGQMTLKELLLQLATYIAKVFISLLPITWLFFAYYSFRVKSRRKMET